jgi:electron transfer flavoprotein beta subunit
LEIVVCIKRVPETAEAELKIAASQKEILKENLVFDTNESDNYALEAALLLKEKVGGSITLVSTGPAEAEEVIRMGLAKGADRAVRITDPKLAGSDGYATARTIAQAVKGLKYDLILCGCIASDDGFGQVGPTLAEILGIPHAVYVTKLEVNGNVARVHRELEGGLMEVLEITLLAIQTGINEPRYASMIGIKRAAAKEIKVFDCAALGLADGDVGEAGSQTTIDKLYVPPRTRQAEMITGSPDAVTTRMAQLIKEKGVLQ